MDSPRVRSVNLGQVADLEFPGGVERTAIGRVAVDSPVRFAAPRHQGEAGLAGDEIGDSVHHGGRDQAVYAYAREDLDYFVELLGVALPDGFFGENLTTTGIELNRCLIGERWDVGGVVLEVASVRIPCRTFTRWLEHHDIDAVGWVKRFTSTGRPGIYLRVLEPGEVVAGDRITVLSIPAHDVDASTMFAALTTSRDLLPRLRAVDDLAVAARVRLRAYERSAR